MMAGRLQDKVMLITGAGSGLGREVALIAAEEGAKVVVTDKIEDRIGPVVEAITSKGGQAAGLKADVTSEAEVEAAMAFAVETFGVLMPLRIGRPPSLRDNAWPVIFGLPG
jgi:NAD(P)-dependent dehydrogenase (short-subunit alcohol dehydrogenase family)